MGVIMVIGRIMGVAFATTFLLTRDRAVCVGKGAS